MAIASTNNAIALFIDTSYRIFISGLNSATSSFCGETEFGFELARRKNSSLRKNESTCTLRPWRKRQQFCQCNSFEASCKHGQSPKIYFHYIGCFSDVNKEGHPILKKYFTKCLLRISRYLGYSAKARHTLEWNSLLNAKIESVVCSLPK